MKKQPLPPAKPRTITIQLDAEMAGMLDAIMIAQGSLSTPTQVLRACAEAGLIRLVVEGSYSESESIKEASEKALSAIHPARIDRACAGIDT